MPETSPSPNSNDQFLPASPLTSKDVTPPSGDMAVLASVTDINKFREDKESRAGRPPAGPARSMDIKKRETAPISTEEAAETAKSISDLVNIGKGGRGHEPSQTNVSGKKSGGQLISYDNMATIAANADLIRGDLQGKETTPESPAPESPTPESPTPGETTPGETTPGETTPGETTPGETTPEETTPEETTPGETTPEGPYPPFDLYPPEDEDGPEPTPEEPTPEEPTPEEPTPEEPTPEEPTPEEPTPEEPAPGETPPEEPAPEEPTPEDGGPSGPEGPEGPGVTERLAEAARRLDTATERYARARVNSERIFGGRNDEELQLATAELQEAFREFSSSSAERAASVSADMAPRIEAINQERSVITSNMEAINQSIENAVPTDDISVLYNNLRVYRERQEELNAEEARINAEQTRLEADSQAEVVERLSQVRQNVDSQMLAERERTSPALARMAEWLRRNPTVRIVAGLALVGTGFIGAVTGNVPLVVAAMAGRAALGAFGGYNAARGVGEWIGDKKYNRSDVNSIEGYTEAAERQSKTRRKSKKTGAVLGAAAAAIPIIKGIGQLNDMVNAPKPSVAGAPKAQLPTPAPAPPELPVTDTRFPWTHMTDQIGSNGTPRIMEIANNAPKLGWQVIGNGQGGGSGAILRIIDPVGKVYEGNGPINAALDYLGTQTP